MTTEQPETLVTQEMQDQRDVWSAPRVSWPISASDLRKWAQSSYWPEVPPRIYWDEEYAKTTKWGGIIAPQDFNPFAWPLEGAYGQAQALAEVLGTPPPETGRTMGSGPGSNAMNGGMTNRYLIPMRVGDVITSRTALVDWNERTTRLGLTMFVTNETRWTNQKDEIVVVKTQVSIRY